MTAVRIANVDTARELLDNKRQRKSAARILETIAAQAPPNEEKEPWNTT